MVAGLKNSLASSKSRAKAQFPPNITIGDRDPTTRDYFNFVRGDIWINLGTTAVPVIRVWMLVRQNNHIATWVLFVSGGGGDIATLTASDGTIAVPVLGNITFPDQVIAGAGTIDSNLQSNVNPNLGPNFTINLKPAIRLPVTNAALTQGAIYFGVNPVLQAYGTANIFVGNASGTTGLTVISAIQNTAVGNATMENLTTGASNTAVGNAALISDTTGSDNTAVGSATLSNLTTGNANTGVGANVFTNVGGNITSGSFNIGLGNGSGGNYRGAESSNILINNTGVLGESNVIKIGTFGSGNGQQNVTYLYGGDVNIPNGRVIMPVTSATAGQVVLGANRFLHGYGTANTFVGDSAGNTSLTVVSSTSNTGVGTAALLGLTTGANNSALGWANLSVTTTGTNNTAVGAGVLTSLTTGSNNTGVGGGVMAQVGSGVVTGSNNTALGWDAGSNYTGAESNNLMLYHDGVVGENNTIRVGTNGAGAGQQNRCFIAGIRGVTTGVNDAIAVLIDSAHQLGTVSSSQRYKENIEDMANASDVIYQLKPKTFNYKKHPSVPAWGLIAEDVDKVFPQLVVYDAEGLPETVKYHELVPLLLNEIKKLNKRVEILESKLGRLV